MPRPIQNLFTILVVLFLAGSRATAEDWPQFRGPTGQGISQEKNLPVEWSTTKNVAWKRPIPGLGWSSPIVFQGKVYLTTAVPVDGSKDHSLRALCLDAKTGKVLWNNEVFRQSGKNPPRVHRKNSHASPTPLTDGKFLYVHFGHQGTACLDLDGKVVWKNIIKYRPVHGNGGTPIFIENGIVFSCDGGDQQNVVALRRDNGKILWKTRRPTEAFKKFAFSTPLLIDVKGEKQIISPGAGVVCAYDPKTGKEIWRAKYGEGYSIVPRPVFGQGLIFVSSCYDFPTLYAIRPGGQGDVTKTNVAWTLKKGAPHTPSALLVGEELYVISDLGIAHCLDARTGKRHWQQRIGNAFSASPLYADGKIYFQAESGMGTVIEAGKQFKRLARNMLEGRTFASYAVSDGALFIRTEENLYRVQKEK